MTKAFTVARHELFVTIRRRGYLFMTFGIPLLAAIAVLLFLTLRSDDEPSEAQSPLDKLPDRPIGYVDHSGRFADAGELAVAFMRFPDEATAIASLQRGQVDSYFVIASDYMQTGRVTRKARQLNFTESDAKLMRAFLLLQLLGDESPFLLARLVQPARVIEHQLDAAGVELSQVDEEQRYGSSLILVYGFAMILLMTTLIPSGYLLHSVVEEKETRTIEVVLSSLRPLELLAGKVLGQGAMALLQVLIWLGSGWALLHLAAGELSALKGVQVSSSQIAVVLLYFLGGFLLVACFQVGLGAISTNMREGPQYATIFTLPMVVPLWLLSVFVESPNSSLAIILSMIPITAPLAMVQRIGIAVVPWWQTALSLMLLALGILLALWLAAKMFRVSTLLAGTLPKPVELLRLLREA